MDCDDDFETQSQDFLAWFATLPGSTFHPNIKLVDMRGSNAGRGIIATADIEPDTVLFTIPRAGILSAATSSLPPKLPAAFAPAAQADEDDPAAQDPWTSLILVLIHEHLRGASSPWAPYLALLPAAFETPMFWSAAELSELRGTAVAAAVGRADADRMIATKILPVIRAHWDAFSPTVAADAAVPPPDEAELACLAHRMGSAIMAYAFDLAAEDDGDDDGDDGSPNEDGWVEDRAAASAAQQLGMVPMADMLNADADFNAHINHGPEALTARSLRRIRAGEQVLNHYGPVGNGELLRRYGYVTRAHRRWDVVELEWEGVAARVREAVGVTAGMWERAEKKAFPKDVEGEDEVEVMEDGFVIEWGSEEPDSTGHVDDSLEFHGLPEELSGQVKRMFRALQRLDPDGAGKKLADSDSRLRIFLSCVRGALRDKEKAYPTTLEEDMRRVMGRETLSTRLEKAMAVRTGEKTLLREAQRWVSDKLQELGGQADGPAAKRRKMK